MCMETLKQIKQEGIWYGIISLVICETLYWKKSGCRNSVSLKLCHRSGKNIAKEGF